MTSNADDKITIEENPSDEELAVVREGLRSFNQSHAPGEQYRPLEIFLRDSEGSVAGGLLGETYWGWLHVGILWLEEKSRGRGNGSRLLAAAETEAVRRGCRYAHLDTFTFQALPFYQKKGYTVFGVQEDLPPGNRRFYLSKKLA